MRFRFTSTVSVTVTVMVTGNSVAQFYSGVTS